MELDAGLTSLFQSPSVTTRVCTPNFYDYVESMGLVVSNEHIHVLCLHPTYCCDLLERKLGEKIIQVKGCSGTYFKKEIDYVNKVPLLSSLEQVLSDDFILGEVSTTSMHTDTCNSDFYSCTCVYIFAKVMRGHQRSDGLLAEYCDKCIQSTSPVDTPGLQIIAYYDDLEVCNPLGSKAKNW